MSALHLWCATRLLTRLPIGKDAGVVSQEGVVQQTLPETLEHNVLTWQQIGGKKNKKKNKTESLRARYYKK